MTQQISLLDLQFSGNADPKLRRLADEFRKLQQAVNTLIAQGSQSSVARPVSSAFGTLAAGEWDLTVLAGGSTFYIRYNDGGTIRTGVVSLS